MSIRINTIPTTDPLFAKSKWFSLLQVDEDDRWGLTFHNCDMLYFLISPDALRNRQWNRVNCYLHSF